jgi:hypothetical protein
LKNICLLFACLVILVSAACGCLRTGLATPDQISTLEESTVKVMVKVYSESADGGSDEDEGGWGGTGIVLDKKVDKTSEGGVKSLILTAGHVCRVPFQVEDSSSPTQFVIVKRSEMRVENLQGKLFKAEILFYSMQPDICAISVFGDAGQLVELADDVPPKGAIVQNVGSPNSFKGPDVFFMSDGRYLGEIGLMGAMKEAVSNPIWPGLSGSGLFYKGKVFGIVTNVDKEFEHIGFADTLAELYEARSMAETSWNE